MPALILLLLASFVSDAEDLAAVQGELRIYLPKVVAVASVIIKLTEQQTSQDKRVISRQSCSLVSGDSCAVSLQYQKRDIDKSKRYYVDISITSQTDKNKQIYPSSFPVLTFNNPNKLNMVISIPSEPIE